MLASAATTVKSGWIVSGDYYNRFAIDASGKMFWGSGAAAADLTLERLSENNVESVAQKWAKFAPNNFVSGILRVGIGTISMGGSAAVYDLDIGEYTIVKVAHTYAGTAIIGGIKNGSHGRILLIFNDSVDYALDIHYEDANATSYRRIIAGTSQTYTLTNDYGVYMFYYDANLSGGRWVLVSTNASVSLW
jgi:hypothetical protein